VSGVLDSRKCIEIYEYCRKQYAKLEKRDKCYNPKHDKIVIAQASREFQMSPDTIEKAYGLAARLVPKLVG
jgi:hypothetical protein